MSYVAGSSDILGNARSTNANSHNLNCTANSPSGLRINVLYGANPLDTVITHYTVDSEINGAMPPPPHESILQIGVNLKWQ